MNIPLKYKQLTILGALVFLPALTTAQSSCGTTGSGAGLKVLQTLKKLMVATDTASVLYRVGFGLTGVDSASVTVVTDTAVCSAVTASVDTAFTHSMHSGPFVVVQAGNLYIAYEAESEPQPMFYIDKATYAYKAWTP